MKKKWWANFRLTHHNCHKHSKYIDSFQTKTEGNNCCGISVTTVYKCSICGEINDIE